MLWPWRKYRKISFQEMRPYVPGEDLTDISVANSEVPKEGGMIARDSNNHKDQWYISQEFFDLNYEDLG